MRCDLHLHTCRSDGAHPPAEVLRLARAARLDVISITDHDTVEAYDELEAAGGRDPRLLRGVELSTALPDGEELHILGYFPRGFTARFRQFLAELQDARRERMRVAVDRLRARGLPIEHDHVRRRCAGSVVSRAHLAQALIELGLVTTFADAFRRYLGSQRHIVPPPAIAPRQAIDIIRRERGISVWAHPAAVQLAPQLPALTRAGLNGLEVYARRAAGSDQPELEHAAREARLLAAGGSDWHGHDTRHALGSYTVPAAAIRQLLSLFDLESPSCAPSR